MTTITKVLASVAFLSLLAAPASARYDADDSALSAYPRYGAERGVPADVLVNRPIR